MGSRFWLNLFFFSFRSFPWWFLTRHHFAGRTISIPDAAQHRSTHTHTPVTDYTGQLFRAFYGKLMLIFISLHCDPWLPFFILFLRVSVHRAKVSPKVSSRDKLKKEKKKRINWNDYYVLLTNKEKLNFGSRTGRRFDRVTESFAYFCFQKKSDAMIFFTQQGWICKISEK